MTSTVPKTSRISIIIPTLNEERVLPGLLTSLRDRPGVEIIVADGGSTDATPEIAHAAGVRLLSLAPGRGGQLRAGAAAATGETLLFLHADTMLPPGFSAQVDRLLSTPHTVAGAFRLAIDAPGLPYRFIEWGANLRSRLLQLPYGDQALFMRRVTYERVGGFPAQPLLEDLELVRRLRRLGKIRLASTAVRTSSRRWRTNGIFRTLWRNQLVLAGYLAGIDPYRLARFYYRKKS
ncbi:MAG: TIGR04283 family arsenosugar biosynthesis glycosyltransferase [Desulfobulbaceae bacterium]